MVEPLDVRQRMVALAAAVDPELTQLSPALRAALELARALGKSYAAQPAER